MKKLKVLVFGLAATALCLLSGCQTQAERSGIQQVILASSNVTGSLYQYAVPATEIVSAYNDAFQFIPISTTGTKENMDLMDVQEADAAGAVGVIIYDAYTGQGPWAETGAIDFGIGYVCYPDYVQIITRGDADLHSLQDLEGKRISVNLKNSSSDLLAQIIFGTLGISYRPYYLDNTDSESALQEGTIDAFIQTGGLRASVCMEIAASKSGMGLIPFTPEEAELVAAATSNIYHTRVIPAGNYEGVDQETLTIGGSTALCFSSDLSEDVVYEIVKTLEEHHGELADAMSSAEFSSAANTVAEWGDTVVPLHPGAARYFQELGLLTND